MDPATRIDLAHARLEERRQVAIGAAAAGPPCRNCANFVPYTPNNSRLAKEPMCSHLAYTDTAFNPVDGEMSYRVEVPASKARAPDGLCGPEAALFEPKPVVPEIVRKVGRNFYLYMYLAMLWFMSGLVFWAEVWPRIIG